MSMSNRLIPSKDESGAIVTSFSSFPSNSVVVVVDGIL
jgi:hypothetical protein